MAVKVSGIARLVAYKIFSPGCGIPLIRYILVSCSLLQPQRDYWEQRLTLNYPLLAPPCQS